MTILSPQWPQGLARNPPEALKKSFEENAYLSANPATSLFFVFDSPTRNPRPGRPSGAVLCDHSERRSWRDLQRVKRLKGRCPLADGFAGKFYQTFEEQ